MHRFSAAVRQTALKPWENCVKKNVKRGELWWRKGMFRCGEIENIKL